MLNFMIAAFILLGLGIHEPKRTPGENLKLPVPRYSSNVSVEKALLKRRSIREYKNEGLTLKELSQLLWAAQGITDAEGFRTAPSAGALYPLEVYVAVGNVEGINQGIYKYVPDGHKLVKIKGEDVREKLRKAAFCQLCISRAPIDIVFVGAYERTTGKYGRRGIRYVHMEVGHAAQNVYLQAEALNLGTVVIGAFDDEEVKKILGIPQDENPLCIMPVGKR